MVNLQVTTRKKWPEISSILGLGTTSTSGFTLKKQYCKYLYGYECKERGLPEPQEAMARYNIEVPKFALNMHRKNIEITVDCLHNSQLESFVRWSN